MCIHIYIYIYKNLRLATLACRFDGKVCFHHACEHKLKKKWFVELFFFSISVRRRGRTYKNMVPGRCPRSAREVPEKCFSHAFRSSGGRQRANLKKVANPREAVRLFRSEWSNYHQFLKVLTTNDFSAQARCFLMVFCGFSKTPRLCRKFVLAVPVQ